MKRYTVKLDDGSVWITDADSRKEAKRKAISRYAPEQRPTAVAAHLLSEFEDALDKYDAVRLY